MVAVSELTMFGADELFARYRQECFEDRRLANPAAPQLPFDHCLALSREVCHGFAQWSHLGLRTPSNEGRSADDRERYRVHRFDPRTLRPLPRAFAVPAIRHRCRAPCPG